MSGVARSSKTESVMKYGLTGYLLVIVAPFWVLEQVQYVWLC